MNEESGNIERCAAVARGDWCSAGNTVRRRSDLLPVNAAAYDRSGRENQRTTSFITEAPRRDESGVAASRSTDSS
ncbi:hypothetical protein [Variovorax paradoxus]|uniref:hypothetical protein n=1 Tax=Variovorax paradoxus TaxID=34073 RepID=UPI00155DC964|nr:hypothetical protein [Variovorax paradoxus]